MKEYRLRRLSAEAGAVFPDTLIPVGPVRMRLRRAVNYEDKKITFIADAAGLQRRAVSLIYQGRTSKIKQKNADKLLHVISNYDEYKMPARGLVSAVRSRQILLSLCAQGWTLEHQREILQNNRHITGGFIDSIANNKPVRTLKENEDHILWLAKAIGDKVGPSALLPQRMQSRGIFPVRHYDGVGKLIVQTLTADQRASVQ